MLIEIAEKVATISNPHDPIWTTTIMTYELGSLVQSLIRARISNVCNELKSKKANEASARVELADLITQCYFLAEQMGWDRFDLENDGEERFKERMAEYKQRLDKRR